MFDTLAYAKHLESSGVDRKTAEAHVEAMTKHMLPDLATKQDLETLKHDLTVRVFGIVLGIVGVMNATLFGLLRLTS
ncbi:MAG: hypothetical protein ACT4P2_15740 [Pseudomonadota bacterium]